MGMPDICAEGSLRLALLAAAEEPNSREAKPVGRPRVDSIVTAIKV